MGLAADGADVITDARVLQTEFVPSEVVHRHAEVDTIAGALEPLVDDDRPEDALLFGPTGVGKTCVARYTVSRLREQLLDLRTCYVNCWSDRTRFRVLYRLLDAIDRTVDIHRRSTPKDELLDRLRAADDHPYVAVLDEADQLEDPSLLYDLSRLPHLTLVVVANRETDLFASLSERTSSRLQSSTRLSFDRYGTDELVAILERRAEQGLEPGAISDTQLRRIADAAAGDARIAIGTLRSAARAAERADADAITDAMLTDAIPDARETVRQRAIDQLTDHQRVCYRIVAEAGEIEPGDLYERYRERVDEPRTRRTVRDYLAKLDHYNLVRASGEKRGRTYHAVGRSE